MNGRRSNIRIIAEILRLGEATKTGIMYRVNLSHSQLQKYLDFLVEKRLLELVHNSNTSIYRTTSKGKALLRDIERLSALLGE